MDRVAHSNAWWRRAAPVDVLRTIVCLVVLAIMFSPVAAFLIAIYLIIERLFGYE